MRLVPENKFDIEACDNLRSASKKNIQNILPELILWTKDGNWPVAQELYSILSICGEKIAPSIKKILDGSDEEWKYLILKDLMPNLNSSTIKLLEKDLERISNSPTVSELKEELPKIAEKLLLEIGN